MYVDRFVVPLTCDASGDVTGYTPVCNGRIVQVRYVPDGTNPFDTNADLTISCAESGAVVVVKANFGTVAFSLAPRLSQSAYFRPHNRDPEIPGLYIVGAGTHPGAGVPGVINSAKATARLVLEDLSRSGQALAS